MVHSKISLENNSYLDRGSKFLQNSVRTSVLNAAYFRFIENPSNEALAIVGGKCGLRPSDWARATRWINLPDYFCRGMDGCTAQFLLSG